MSNDEQRLRKLEDQQRIMMEEIRVLRAQVDRLLDEAGDGHEEVLEILDEPSRRSARLGVARLT